MNFLSETSGGVIVSVRAKPRSSRSGIDGVVQDALVVRIKSAPVDGKANKELVETIADVLGIAKSRVSVKSGESSKVKRILALGVTSAEAVSRLGSYT